MGLPTWNSTSNSSGSDSDSEPVKSTGVQRVTNRMEPKVKCGLCKDYFVDPVCSVRCGHTFCLACYQHWAAEHSDWRTPHKCAECSQPFVHLARDWVTSEFVQVHINTLIDNNASGWGPNSGSQYRKQAYEQRVAYWNTRKTGVIEMFTYPERLTRLEIAGAPKIQNPSFGVGGPLY